MGAQANGLPSRLRRLRPHVRPEKRDDFDECYRLLGLLAAQLDMTVLKMQEMTRPIAEADDACEAGPK
jgi:hypothetical protein